VSSPLPTPDVEILLVEDDRDIADSLELLLRDEGFQVELAEDGLEALAAVDAHRPDLILLDVMLPRLDAVGVAAELKARGVGPDRLPVILLSAGSALGDAQRAVGTPYSLRKPFSLEEILGLIRRALAERTGPAPA
jgi:two-component system response regulator MprA